MLIIHVFIEYMPHFEGDFVCNLHIYDRIITQIIPERTLSQALTLEIW